MTEEVEIYRPQSSDLTIGRTATDDWYDPFPKIIKLAEYVANTEFVPEPMRNRPAAIAAAILTGREMGLPPMVSLRHLYVVKGRVGQSAELMRAQIYRAGHHMRDVEVTDTRCIVEGRRDDEQEWTRVQFTAEDARKAHIQLENRTSRDGKPIGSFPKDVLYARATSRLARRKFADAVMGLPVVDELEDAATPAEVVELAPAAPIKRSRAIRKPKAANTQPQPPHTPEPIEAERDEWADDPDAPGAGLPADKSGQGTAEHGTPPPAPANTEQLPEPAPKRRGRPRKTSPPPDTPANEPPADEWAANMEAQTAAAIKAIEAERAPADDRAPGPDQLAFGETSEELITKPQLTKLHVLLNETGLGDRDTGLAWLSAATGRPIDTSKALTKNEATRIIDTLEI